MVDVSLAVLLTLAFSSPPHCVCRLGGSIFPRRAPFFSNRTGGATADRTLNEDSELASPPYTPIRRFIGGLASAAAGVVIIEAGRSRTTTTSTSTTRTQQPSSALPSVPQRPTKAHTNVRLTKKTPSSGIKYIGVSRAKTYALRDHTSLPRPLPLVRPIASHPPRLSSPAGRLSLGPLRIHSPRPPSTLTAQHDSAARSEAGVVRRVSAAASSTTKTIFTSVRHSDEQRCMHRLLYLASAALFCVHVLCSTVW